MSTVLECFYRALRGRAVGRLCESVCVSEQELLNKMTFDLNISQGDSIGPQLGQARGSRS